jgi:signal peptidase II
MSPSPSPKYIFFALIAGGVLILPGDEGADLEQLLLGAGIEVIPGFFDLTHVQNPGGAFGFLATMSPTLRGLLFTAVSALAAGLIVAVYHQTPVDRTLTRIGLTLVFGGAVGNLVDRLRFSAVVDFLDVYIGDLHWPAFNVADSAITVGVCLFALQMAFKKSNTPGRSTED